MLWLHPSLHQEPDGLDFEVRYLGHWGINLHLTPQLLRVRVAASDAAPVRIGINGQVVELPPGSTREFPALTAPSASSPFGGLATVLAHPVTSL